MLENVFVFLYPVVVVISIVGYIPQIKSLITAKTCPDNISIHSWYIWTLSTFLTLGYGVTHIRLDGAPSDLNSIIEQTAIVFLAV